MTGPEVVELVAWLQQQQRREMREAARLNMLAGAFDRRPARTADELRQSFTVAADVAACTARLETWNEVLTFLREGLAAG